MTTPESSHGSLCAELDVRSYQLQQNMPIDVRDGRLALVKQIRHGQTLNLIPGWYEVSAVLDDGQRHSKIVQVRAGGSETIQFQPDPDKILPRSKIQSRRGTPPDVARELDRSLPDPVQLLGSEECKIIDMTPTMWRFGPVSTVPQSMPTARFSHDNAVASVSLPINPVGEGTLAESVVTFSSHKDRFDVRAGFHSDRIVSTAILNMVDRGQLTHATLAVEQTADDMLGEKYKDPVGAALGALIMYRAGTLQRHKSWLENLARDFNWLPEGKILLAALPQELTCERKADFLIRASQQRPMFTESYSILFETLRGWASDHRRGEIREALDAVAQQLPRLEWNAFTFTVRES